MKNTFLFFLVQMVVTSCLLAQGTITDSKHNQEIYSLIEKYSQAREKKDTVLLRSILTADVDQLVSSGEWRNGIHESIDGMLRSSDSNPGTRTLKVDKVRFFNAESGIVDAKYEIQNTDGTVRKMWSTFIVVYNGGVWKISAIRNMLPSGRQ